MPAPHSPPSPTPPPAPSPDPGHHSKRSPGTTDSVAKEVRRKRKVYILLGVLLVFGLGAVVSARPAYRTLKGMRARATANESLALTAKGNLREAFAKARLAYKLSRFEPQSLRAMAEVLGAAGNFQEAGVYWKALASLPNANVEDLRAGVESTLRSGDVALAAQQLALLIARDGASSKTVQLGARLKFNEGQKTEALAEARRAQALDPADERARLLLGSLLLSMPEHHAEGESQLRTLGALPSKTGLEAVGTLAIDPGASIQTQEWLADVLGEHPLAEDWHRLKAFEMQWRMRPTKRAALWKDARARFESGSPELLGGFAGSLLALNEPRRVLEILPEADALKRKELLLLHVEALSALSRWSQISEILQKRDLPIPKPLAQFYNARCQSELGNKSEASQLWSAAVQGAGSDPRLLAYMVNYAQKTSNEELAGLLKQKQDELAGIVPEPMFD